MPFRFRRSARLGPLRFNFSSSGLSSISVGGRGASFNIPVARSGGARTTVGMPGTGLSWSVEHNIAAGLPNSRRLRPGQLEALKASSLNLLQQKLFRPGATGARTSGLLVLIETPEAMAAYLLRAQGQDDLKRRARRCIEAAEEARRLAQALGWLP